MTVLHRGSAARPACSVPGKRHPESLLEGPTPARDHRARMALGYDARRAGVSSGGGLATRQWSLEQWLERSEPELGFQTRFPARLRISSASRRRKRGATAGIESRTAVGRTHPVIGFHAVGGLDAMSLQTRCRHRLANIDAARQLRCSVSKLPPQYPRPRLPGAGPAKPRSFVSPPVKPGLCPSIPPRSSRCARLESAFPIL